MNPSRRIFISKVAYTVPTLLVLGTLTTPLSAHSSSLGGKSDTKFEVKHGKPITTPSRKVK